MLSLNRRRLMQLSGAAALAGPACALADPARGETVTSDWSGDVAVLRRAWETMHPGVHRYATPSQIAQRLDALSGIWARPGTFRERFLALSRTTASLRCGHTYPSPYNGDEAMVSRLYPDRALVPFRFRWLDGRMVVTHDDTGEGLLPRASVVSHIDGVSCRDLLAGLVPLARADGGNDAKRVNLMEVRGDDRYETFDIHLPLLLPLSGRATFTLDDGRTVTARLLTLAERQATNGSADDAAKDANPWTLEQGPEGVHRLTMPGWALYNSTFDWEAWLGGVMDELNGDGARGLVIDLRGNEGGLDCGNVILSRLISADLPLSRNQRWTRYRTAPQDLHPYLETWDRSFLDWGEAAQPSADRLGYFRLTRYDDGAETTVIAPRGNRFKGRVAVLCDASNSSATFGFAQAVRDSGVATLVGQPTGGNLRGINGGAFFFLKLPASGLEVDLPLIASFPETPQPDAPVYPDLDVPTTAADIAASRDPQMTAALSLLTSG